MHASLEQLISLRDGAPVDAGAAVHVRDCTACRTEAAQLGRWRQRLIDLPALEAPAGAWQKIATRLDEQPHAPRRRYRVPALGAALAASLVAAVVLVTWTLQAPPPSVSAATADSPALTQLQSQSRYLEQAVQAMNADSAESVTNAGTAATVAALEDRIALVDYAINQAGTGPRPPQDLTVLWQQRVNLMRSLAAVRYAQVSAVSWDQ